jgi:hypothetical protein
MLESMITNVEKRPTFFTYPYGYYNPFTEGLLKTLGYYGSVTVDEGVNSITRDPNSLFSLKRIDASKWLSSDDIIMKIESYYK